MNPETVVKTQPVHGSLKSAPGQMHVTGFIDPSFRQAQSQGMDPSVLSNMQESVVQQFIVRCAMNHINPLSLNLPELREGVGSVVNGATGKNERSIAMVRHDSFDDFHRRIATEMKQQGPALAEKRLDAAMESMRLVHGELIKEERSIKVNEGGAQAHRQAFRNRLENSFVQIARDAASAHKVSGQDPAQLYARIEADPVLGSSRLSGKVYQMLEDEGYISPTPAQEQTRKLSSRFRIS